MAAIDPVTELKPKARVLKVASVRRAEIVDFAETMFLSQGYEATTVQHVIDRAGLSKGAFYHHFRSKEDLLEAISVRYAERSLTLSSAIVDRTDLDALEKLNLLLALAREWKAEHIGDLKAVFTTLLKPENVVLYQRIVDAVFAVMTPILTTILEQGRRDEVFALDDAALTAETLLWLSNGRRPVVVAAMALAESDLAAAVDLIVTRLRAEEALIARLLGLLLGDVRLFDSAEQIRAIMQAWNATQTPVSPPPTQ